MNTIRIESGEEGPRHDPYHWEEITFQGRVGKVQVHLGLSTWLTWNGKLITDNFNLVSLEFEKIVGLLPHKLLKAQRQALEGKIRHHPCGHKDIGEVEGHPGETFLICHKCRTVFNTSFNESAVI